MSIFDQPLRTRERAAVDVARAALRKIAQIPDENDARFGKALATSLAAEALERIAVILGERDR